MSTLPVIPTLSLLLVAGLAAPLGAQFDEMTPTELESHWHSYTSYQKRELLGFAEFLFERGYYDRAELVFQRFALLHSGDPTLPAVYYRMGQCAEGMESYPKAIRHYERAKQEAAPHSSEAVAALRRMGLVLLISDQRETLEGITEKSSDPWMLTFLGYDQFRSVQMDDARKTLGRAKEAKGSSEVESVLDSLIIACEAVESLPRARVGRATLLALVPGAGHGYLSGWWEAVGPLAATGVMGLGVAAATVASSKAVMATALAGHYAASILGVRTQAVEADRRTLESFVQSVCRRFPPETLLTFPEPSLSE